MKTLSLNSILAFVLFGTDEKNTQDVQKLLLTTNLQAIKDSIRNAIEGKLTINGAVVPTPADHQDALAVLETALATLDSDKYENVFINKTGRPRDNKAFILSENPNFFKMVSGANEVPPIDENEDGVEMLNAEDITEDDIEDMADALRYCAKKKDVDAGRACEPETAQYAGRLYSITIEAHMKDGKPSTLNQKNNKGNMLNATLDMLVPQLELHNADKKVRRRINTKILVLMLQNEANEDLRNSLGDNLQTVIKICNDANRDVALAKSRSFSTTQVDEAGKKTRPVGMCNFDIIMKKDAKGNGSIYDSANADVYQLAVEAGGYDCEYLGGNSYSTLMYFKKNAIAFRNIAILDEEEGEVAFAEALVSVANHRKLVEKRANAEFDKLQKQDEKTFETDEQIRLHKETSVDIVALASQFASMDESAIANLSKLNIDVNALLVAKLNAQK